MSHYVKTLLFGLPACVFSHRTTMFDLMLPRLWAMAAYVCSAMRADIRFALSDGKFHVILTQKWRSIEEKGGLQ